MKVLESEIVKWHCQTFPNATEKAIKDKLLEECQELIKELYESEEDDILNECADIVIVAVALFGRQGRCLSDFVNQKLEINKNRTWGKEIENGDRPREK